MLDYEIINENLRQALAAFVRVRPGGQMAHAEGLSLVYAGVPYSLFNTALITAALPSHHGGFYDQIDRAEDFFQKHNAPWSMWFCEDMLSPEERRKARIALATRRLHLTMEAPGMITPALIEPSSRLPRLDFVRVGDALTRDHFSHVMSAAFQVPVEMSRDVYCGEMLWASTMIGWIGYLRGEPITTTAVIATGEAIGMYAVATQPHFQRKGYAEAVMRHAIAEASASTGTGRTVLQSSTAGYPLYVRMGYRPVTRFLVYVK